MRRVALAAMLSLGLGACGARTGLYADERTTDAAPRDGANAQLGDGGGREPSVYCALKVGPVDSCDAGPDAGPVQRCYEVFPYCINRGGYGWGCCVSPAFLNCVWAYYAGVS